MTPDLLHLVERLTRASARPRPALEWPPRLDREQWYFSPELLSLHGTAAWVAMSEPERRRLGVLEAVSFFSLNLHGERFLVHGLIERAASPGWEGLAPYLEQFRADEERHTATFGEFCQRYAGKVYRDHGAAALRAPLRATPAPGEADVLFVARVLIFEEIADAYNRYMAADARLAPLARAINRLHHLDETRHLAFGRALLEALLARDAPRWDAATLPRVRAALTAFLTATWRAYCNPDVYRDAGLTDVCALRELAYEAGAERRRMLVERCRSLSPIRLLAMRPGGCGADGAAPSK